MKNVFKNIGNVIIGIVIGFCIGAIVVRLVDAHTITVNHGHTINAVRYFVAMQ